MKRIIKLHGTDKSFQSTLNTMYFHPIKTCASIEDGKEVIYVYSAKDFNSLVLAQIMTDLKNDGKLEVAK